MFQLSPRLFVFLARIASQDGDDLDVSPTVLMPPWHPEPSEILMSNHAALVLMDGGARGKSSGYRLHLFSFFFRQNQNAPLFFLSRTLSSSSLASGAFFHRA